LVNEELTAPDDVGRVPYDPDSVAAAIGQALSMPLVERREQSTAVNISVTPPHGSV
jgi:hypothetical protein